ncbi:acyltransferase family protein [Commensalibacter intestini]|nr:acyltransferase [Commensalibacter intestini]
MLFGQIPMVFEIAIFTTIIVSIFSTKYFSFLDKAEQGRELTIDGLRAFLALAVIYHHMVFSYNLFYGKGWIIDYPVNARLGKVALSFFFMISAYILTQKNIQTTCGFIKFYINRFFRIAPMFWLSTSICLGTAIIFGSHIDYYSLLDKLCVWYDAGLFLTDRKPDINNFDKTYFINAGVMWSLSWEWLLYFSLPILIVLRHKINSFIISQFLNFIAVYCISYLSYTWAVFILCFSLGMTARDIKPFIKIPKTANNIIILLCLCIIFLRKTGPFDISTIVIEFILFVCICQGGDFFGILRSKGAVRLGEVSYSIYLLHGIVLFYMNKILVHWNLSKIEYGLTALLCIILVCLSSCFTFVLIESKGIMLGRHIYKKCVIEL